MLITVDKLSRTPIYEQIISQVEMHILLGDLVRGDLLPSVRSLSVELGVNPNTLQKAYAELERRGLCVSVPGNGRFITECARHRLTDRSRQSLSELSALVLRLTQAGVTGAEILSCVQSALAQANEEGETTHD